MIKNNNAEKLKVGDIITLDHTMTLLTSVSVHDGRRMGGFSLVDEHHVGIVVNPCAIANYFDKREMIVVLFGDIPIWFNTASDVSFLRKMNDQES